MDEIMLQRRIVCAANRNGLNKIVLGARHFDQTMSNNIAEYYELMSWKGYDISLPEFAFKKQGFINTWGQYLTRQEAWKVAEYNNQIIKRVGGDTVNGGTLFSENLY